MMVEVGGDALPDGGHDSDGGTTGRPFVADEDRERRREIERSRERRAATTAITAA